MGKLRIGRIDKQSNGACLGDYFMQQFESLRRDFRIQGRYAGNIAAGPVEAGNETGRHRVYPGVEDNRNGRGRRLGCKRRGYVGDSDYGDLSLNQVRSQQRKSVMVVFPPPVFNRYIPAFDKPGLVQALMKRGHDLPGVTGRFAVKESNDRDPRLLRARRERPRRCAAEKREEIATLDYPGNEPALIAYELPSCIYVTSVLDLPEADERPKALVVMRDCSGGG
jgi:hypothetical protein